MKVSWVSDAGLSRISDKTIYLYTTDRPMHWDDKEHHAVLTDSVGKNVGVCAFPDWHIGDPVSDVRDALICATTRNRAPQNVSAADEQLIVWPFPYSLVAIDPDQERALAGLDAAVVEGRSIPAADRPHDVHGTLRTSLVDEEIKDLGSHGHAV